MSVKLNLHSHTIASNDSLTSIKDLENLFNKDIVNQVAITDHDEIWYAKEAFKQFGPEKIIVGSEASTDKGKHIIGLFIEEELPVKASAKEVAKIIKDQGGLVYIPHMYEPRNGIGEETADELLEEDLIDVIEGFNSWVYPNILNAFKGRVIQNEKAWIYAKKYDLPVVSSSDSHTIFCFSNAYSEIEKPVTKETLVEELKSKNIKHKRLFSKLNSYVPRVAFKSLKARTLDRKKFREFNK